MRAGSTWAALLAALLGARPALAQLDPEKRQLVQFGYEQPLSGRGPLGGYAFYYLNNPGALGERTVLRLAVAPVYLDAEVGLREAIGPHTHLAWGVFGGGFSQNHNELRGGHFHEEESFTGHGGGASISVYRLFNPGSRIPLNGVLRGALQNSSFETNRETRTGFIEPPDHNTAVLRSGLRWGGQEPLLEAPRAMELSAWYEARVRDRRGPYGLDGDRSIERDTHLFWGRALLAYTSFEKGFEFGTSLTAGASLRADRLNAYRLGGGLPLTAEFPLSLPGYYHQELSAQRFALLDGRWGRLVGQGKWFGLGLRAAVAYVDYLPGMGQPGSIHAGVGSLFDVESPHATWKLVFGHGYGFAARRHRGRGAHSLSFMLQWNLRAREGTVPPRPAPRLQAPFWRFLQRLSPWD